MKIANLIPVYLAQEKKIELQGLGRFTFTGEEMEPQQEDFVFPAGSLQFDADPKTGLNEQMIRFLMEKSGKVRSLVVSDLDSFLQLGIQFLNLGKPFELPGMGEIRKNAQGKLEFIQGDVFRAKIELREPPKTEHSSQHNAISFRSEKKKAPVLRHKNRIIAIVILSALTITYLLIKKSDQPSAEIKLTADSTQQTKAMPSSLNDSSKGTTAITESSSLRQPESQIDANARGFRIVVKEYSSYSKAIRFKQLLERNHEVVVFTRDSSVYKVAIPFDLPLADSTGTLDSIQYMLGLPVYVDLP